MLLLKKKKIVEMDAQIVTKSNSLQVSSKSVITPKEWTQQHETVDLKTII